MRLKHVRFVLMLQCRHMVAVFIHSSLTLQRCFIQSLPALLTAYIGYKEIINLRRFIFKTMTMEQDQI